jgi:hypothetical protein
MAVALADLLTIVLKLTGVFCAGASISSFCEQLVIANAATAANKIFFIFVCFKVNKFICFIF